ALSASIEQVSEHKHSQTIIKEADERKLTEQYVEVTDAEAIKARGVAGTVGDDKYFIGNKKLIDEENITISDDILNYYIKEQKEGQTAMFIAKNKDIIGLISIMDKIKSDAHAAVKNLRAKGAKNLVMITGE